MDGATVSGNRVYSNSIGIQTTNVYVFGGKILNNLVYANTNEGLLIRDAQPGSLVANNTIYQPVGDAIRVQDSSTGLRLENNILYVAAGYDLNVTPDSQNGFASDYNLLVTSGTGQVASGKGRALPRGPIGSTSWASTPTASRAIRCSSIRWAPTANSATRTGSTTVRTTIFMCSTAHRLWTPATRPRRSALNRHPTAAG